MTHSDVGFGPGYYVLGGIAALIMLCALALVIDPMRSKRSSAYEIYLKAGARKAPLYIYQILGLLYVLISILAAVPSFRDKLAMISVVGLPIILITEIVYLLRVVYPKPLATPTSVEEIIKNDDGE